MIYDRVEALDVGDICHRCWARDMPVDQVLDETRKLILAEGGVTQELAPIEGEATEPGESASGSDASSSTDLEA